MTEWLSQGGYALFIWPSYIITFGVILWMLLVAYKTLRHNTQLHETLRHTAESSMTSEDA